MATEKAIEKIWKARQLKEHIRYLEKKYNRALTGFEKKQVKLGKL